MNLNNPNPPRNGNKPILSLDFDGVMHSYTSGWRGADQVLDPPVAGLFEFLEDACKVFDVQVYSSRSHQEGGIQAMMEWLIKWRKHWRENGGEGAEVLEISFPDHKPAAKVSIDDRAVTFVGRWPRVEDLAAFEPWNKLGVRTQSLTR